MVVIARTIFGVGGWWDVLQSVIAVLVGQTMQRQTGIPFVYAVILLIASAPGMEEGKLLSDLVYAHFVRNFPVVQSLERDSRDWGLDGVAADRSTNFAEAVELLCMR
ncbi:hypothetical protein Ancab_023633 [Ancistrocladus abbreviatus]